MEDEEARPWPRGWRRLNAEADRADNFGGVTRPQKSCDAAVDRSCGSPHDGKAGLQAAGAEPVVGADIHEGRGLENAGATDQHV